MVKYKTNSCWEFPPSDIEPDALAKLENEQLVRFVETKRKKWKAYGAKEERAKIVEWLRGANDEEGDRRAWTGDLASAIERGAHE